MTLEELGIPYTFNKIDFFGGEHKTPEYLAKHHPFGKIPSLYDGDFHIFESRPISIYLATKYDKTQALYPNQAEARGLVEQWISIEQNYHDCLEKLVAELFFKPVFFKKETDEKVVENEEKRLHIAYEVLDKHLQGRKFLVGDKLTVADIVYMPYIEYLLMTDKFKNVLEKYPNIDAWWKSLSGRPTWQKIREMK